jgi:hypothetical protein
MGIGASAGGIARLASRDGNLLIEREVARHGHHSVDERALRAADGRRPKHAAVVRFAKVDGDSL